MKVSNYSLKARYFPAIINTLPVIIIVISLTNHQLQNLFNDLLEIKIISDISLSIIFIYLVALLQRVFSKEIFENIIFKKGLTFPSTTFLLLGDNTYSKQYKKKIRNKILSDFDILLPSKEEETTNIELVRKKIMESVALVRRKVGDGTLTLQHNIEYGFIRNLIGGGILGILGTIAIIILEMYDIVSKSASTAALILLLFYCLILILSKTLLNKFSVLYTNILYQDYLTMD